MATSDILVQKRTSMELTKDQLAKKCHISWELLDILEHGGVTHPKIVKRIQTVYSLTDEEADELKPDIFRRQKDEVH